MPDHQFEHLPLILRYQGAARLRGFPEFAPQTLANRAARQAHSQTLQGAATTLSQGLRAKRAQRTEEEMPPIPQGIPILLQIDPALEVDELRKRFSFEVVGEQEEGYVIVASEDIDMGVFQEVVRNFSGAIRGSSNVALVHRLFDDPKQIDRLRRILSEDLFARWPLIADDAVIVVDVGIACTGTGQIPSKPNRGKRDSDADWARKEFEWSQARSNAYTTWDETKASRETEIENFTHFYNGEILHFIDGESVETSLPDSFTVRIRIVGKGFKDFVLNYPYIFEVVEPDDIRIPTGANPKEEMPPPGVAPVAPPETAPSICVVDSGIQENHLLLEPAIDQATSRCFIPGEEVTAVSDRVAPGGHGTRVAGAVLYGETVAMQGTPQLPFWIQNARVLNSDNVMPVEMFPAAVIRAVIEHYHHEFGTRIFNHSINANGFCRTRYMSSWAAEIDLLSEANDILIIQSAGNLRTNGIPPFIGIKNHLEAGRTYPIYLTEPSARIASPGQSLQALTVGSIGYGAFASGSWQTFAPDEAHPSAFSRSGPGIWDVIKPEVVEFGGDCVRTSNDPVDVQGGGTIPDACPELVRSTLFPPGPAADKDEVGTSFAAPKVARIAARLEQILPSEPALLYRALIVQSARWPVWAEALLQELRDPGIAAQRKDQVIAEVSRLIRSLGYGLPEETRATTNTDHRTTFITSDETPIRAKGCHIYQIPIPAQLHRPADEFDIRIDVTLSFVAQPRRTRRQLRRYLSTWVDWKTSRLGEGIDDFRARALKDSENEGEAIPGTTLPWVLSDTGPSGLVRNTRRTNGTVQKDWAVVKSNTLPDQFCIAVVGHQGWSHDPDSTARYTLAVTIEALGQEIPIYEELRTAVHELQTEIEAEAQAEAEAEVEIEE